MIYTIKERTDPRMQEKRRLSSRATSWRMWVAPLGRVRGAPPGQSWTVLSFVYSESRTTEGCHGTQLDWDST